MFIFLFEKPFVSVPYPRSNIKHTPYENDNIPNLFRLMRQSAHMECVEGIENSDFFMQKLSLHELHAMKSKLVSLVNNKSMR